MKETTCLTIMTSDHAWTENNGKVGLAGIFDSFNLPNFPALVAPFSVYVRLENVKKGENQIVLDFVNESTNQVISSINANFVAQQDQDISQFHASFPPSLLPSSGNFSIILRYNSKQIAKHIIRVNQIPGAANE